MQDPPPQKLNRPDLEPRPVELRDEHITNSRLDHLDVRRNKILVSLFDSSSGPGNERVIFSDEVHALFYLNNSLHDSRERAVILTNYALYLFPPLVWVEKQRYIVANDYLDFHIACFTRISLPYRTKHEGREQIAVRTNESALHTIQGKTLWLSFKNAKRQDFVEAFCDVYSHYLGTRLLLHQEDYKTLLASITRSQIWDKLKRTSLRAWAAGCQILKSGRLMYQERSGNRNRISKRWRKKWVALFIHALIVLDSHEDLELLRRGQLFSTKGSSRFSAFRLRGCRIRQNRKRPIQWRVLEDPDKNVLVEEQRCGEFSASSPQDTQVWLEAISRRRDLCLRKAKVSDVTSSRGGRRLKD